MWLFNFAQREWVGCLLPWKEGEEKMVWRVGKFVVCRVADFAWLGLE
jgi:hypothetical protein